MEIIWSEAASKVIDNDHAQRQYFDHKVCNLF